MTKQKYFIRPRRHAFRFREIEVTGSSFTVRHGREGTVGKSFLRVFEDEAACLREAARLSEGWRKRGYVETEEGYIKNFELPPALKESLTRERKVRVPQGEFTVPALQNIKLITVAVNCREVMQATGDENPYTGEKGLFSTTAYALATGFTGAGNTRKILVWLPIPEAYATWHPAQRKLYFHAASCWKHIEKDLPRYLFGNGENNGLAPGKKVWDYFDFIPGNLLEEIGNMLRLSPDRAEMRVEEFLSRYEQRLLRHPVCSILENEYKELVKLYLARGQSFEKDGQYEKAMVWYRRSLLVINQSPLFRAVLFTDVFLKLGTCCFRTSRYDASLSYLAMYRLYRPAAQAACGQIEASIVRVRQLHREALDARRKLLERGTAECYEEAIRITLAAIRVAPHDPLLYFNIACFYSLSYKTREALYYLEEALKKGYRISIANEQDLDNIRKTREFEAMTLKYC